MSRTHALRGSARAVEATRGPDAYPSEGARFLDALRAHPTVKRKWTWGRALDQAVWTATGAFLGFTAALLATYIYFAEAWL